MARCIIVLGTLFICNINAFVVERWPGGDRMNVSREICKNIGGFKHNNSLCFCNQLGTLIADLKNSDLFSCDTKNNYTFDITMYLEGKANISFISTEPELHFISFVSNRQKVTTKLCRKLKLTNAYLLKSKMWYEVNHHKNLKLEATSDIYNLIIPENSHTTLQGVLLYLLLSDSGNNKPICEGKMLLKFSGKINFTRGMVSTRTVAMTNIVITEKGSTRFKTQNESVSNNLYTNSTTGTKSSAETILYITVFGSMVSLLLVIVVIFCILHFKRKLYSGPSDNVQPSKPSLVNNYFQQWCNKEDNRAYLKPRSERESLPPVPLQPNVGPLENLSLPYMCPRRISVEAENIYEVPADISSIYEAMYVRLKTDEQSCLDGTNL